MFKVLHVITGLERGGAETVLVRLVCATHSHVDHVVISLGGEGHFASVLRGAGVSVHTLDLGRRRRTLAGLVGLVRLIRREQPNVVQTWMYHADLLGGIAARLAGIRAVVWGVRNTNLETAAIGHSTRLVAWLSARLSGIMPAAIVCSSIESSRAHIAFGYRAARFRIIANGFDVESFRPDPDQRAAVRAALGIRPGEVLVGNVARWDPQKDHANLLGALRIAAQRRVDLRVLMVGQGVEPANRQLAALVREAGLEERTTLAGPRDDIPAIMNAIDLYVLSSFGEAFPNAVAEAMACGTPCVVTDVGDAAQIVGDTGWVARPRDAPALAAAIEVALVTIKRQGPGSLAARCRNRIVEHYNLSRMTETFDALWNEIAAQSKDRH